MKTKEVEVIEFHRIADAISNFKYWETMSNNPSKSELLTSRKFPGNRILLIVKIPNSACNGLEDVYIFVELKGGNNNNYWSISKLSEVAWFE